MRLYAARRLTHSAASESDTKAEMGHRAALRMPPKLPVTSLRGIMRTRQYATIEQMNEAIAPQASESVERRRRG